MGKLLSEASLQHHDCTTGFKWCTKRFLSLTRDCSDFLRIRKTSVFNVCFSLHALKIPQLYKLTLKIHVPIQTQVSFSAGSKEAYLVV